jgi:hypothetical protein
MAAMLKGSAVMLVLVALVATDAVLTPPSVLFPTEAALRDLALAIL